MMRESMANRSFSFSFKSVTTRQVGKILSGLRSSNATGVDNIDVASFKFVGREISHCLAHITNISVTTNTFPKNYMYAKVVPLLKSPEKSKLACSFYGPVSLLPVLSRVVKKALFTQLSDPQE